MVSESGAMDRPACIALYPSTICRKIGQHDHGAAEGDLLEHLPADPQPEDLRWNRSGSSSVDLALAFAPHEPVAEAASPTAPDRQEAPDGLAALLPDQDPEHDAAHADDREDGPDEVDAAVAGVGHVLDQPDPGQDDRDDDEPRAGSRRARRGTW